LKLGFDTRPVRVGFVVDAMVLGHVFFRVHLFSPVCIIPPMLRTHLHAHVALNQKDKRAKPGNLPRSNALFSVGDNYVTKNLQFRLRKP
jgi:hypothetical protein